LLAALTAFLARTAQAAREGQRPAAGHPRPVLNMPEAGSPAKRRRSDATAVHRHMRRHRPGRLAGDIQPQGRN
jgi:hypothetical protein